MFSKDFSCNMTTFESYIRFIIASALMVVSIYFEIYITAAIGIILYYSAFTRHCFIYSFLTINERTSQNNYYITQLPKYNKAATFIFDKYGEMLYYNLAARSDFYDIKNIRSFNINNIDEIINKNISTDIVYHREPRTYQITIQGVSKDEVILAYATDVTKIIELNDEIEETQREVIYAMGEIGETRSKETGNHVKRVALYSEKLALLYGLSYEEAELLKVASPMHDIGKVGIPDAILHAPRKLTEDEFEIMKTHAQLGYDMLKNSNKPILKAAATVAGEHHEKYDGSGYPKGTSGEDIHIYGRITAVADVFDALGSERVYKKAWELDEILKFFDEQSGLHFDPNLIKLFKDNLDEFIQIRNAYKD